MSLMNTYKRAPFRIGLVIALVAASALGLKGANAEHRAHLSLDLLTHQSRHTAARARVIVHGSDNEVDALANRHHLQVVRRLAGGAVISANSDELSDWLRMPASIICPAIFPSTTGCRYRTPPSAADQTRCGLVRPSGPREHSRRQRPGHRRRDRRLRYRSSQCAREESRRERQLRVWRRVGGRRFRSRDARRGHHRRLASPALPVTNLYNGGIAPGAQLINIRVLGSDGSGLTSDVIAGIDWAIAHRADYNIRVINLSLGHSVTEPCATDPLCEAVGRAYTAGIVVVAAAGNNGMTPDGHTILGGITSPGNSPVAITVGAREHVGHGRSATTTPSRPTAREVRPNTTSR